MVFLDASEEAGAGTEVLEEAASILRDEYGRSATGPAFAEALLPAPPPGAHVAAIEGLLGEAEAQLGAFDFEQTSRTLSEVARLLEDAPAEEAEPFHIDMHWLRVRLALLLGENEGASSHLRDIVQLAPWWTPPVGFLPPEMTAQVEREAELVGQSGAVIHTGERPEGATVWIDGLDVENRSEIPVAPGRHFVRYQRPGHAHVSRWVQVPAGQTVTLEAPGIPAWDGPRRAGVRAAVEQGLTPDVAQALGRLRAEAGADLLVAGFRPAGGATEQVMVAMVGPDVRVWYGEPGSHDARGLAALVDGALQGRTPRTTSPISPEILLSLGGGGRLVTPAENLVAGGGGPAAELGGGIRIAQRVAILATVAAAFQGPSSLALEPGESQRTGTQRSYLVRVGVVATPRIPLFTATTLIFGGGGGVAFAGIATTTGGGDPVALDGIGVYWTVRAGLEYTPTPHVTLGPLVSYSHAHVPLAGELPAESDLAGVAANAVRTLEVGLRISLHPPG